MEIKLVIALTSHKGDVWKTSIIHRATLLCIFFSFLKGWYSGMLQAQALRVGQEKEPCIGLIQESSIENSV